MLLAHGISFTLRATAGLYVRFRFIASSVVVSILNVQGQIIFSIFIDFSYSSLISSRMSLASFH